MNLVHKVDGKIYRVLKKELWNFDLPGGINLKYYTYTVENINTYFYECIDDRYNQTIKEGFIWNNFYTLEESRTLKLKKLNDNQ